MKKGLPIGIENYIDAQQYYYVDKTMFVKEILQRYIGKALLITRPRRFGKTLLLSMVDAFFDILGSNESLFAEKKILIEMPASRRFLNQVPVVHLNMKNVTGTSQEEILYKAKDEIIAAYRRFAFLKDSPALYANDKLEFVKILNGEIEEEFIYKNAIKKLCSYLFAHYQKKVIILIDEYDTPLESAYSNGIYDQCITFFKELYSSSLKGNEYAMFSICTGVLELSKESLFSGLNNLEVSSVASADLSKYLGFTEEEVKEMLSYYQDQTDIHELSKWYGGYDFGEVEIYNPWSVLNYIKFHEFAPYWVNTGSNHLIDELLDEPTRNELLSLLNSERIVHLNMAINYRDLKQDSNAIYSYLVHAGYLLARSNGSGSYRLGLINDEIYAMFQKDIIGREMKEEGLEIAKSLRAAFLDGDAARIGAILEEYVLFSFSYYDLRKEKDYQHVFVGLLSVLFPDYVVQSEANGLKGRCDIMISPKRTGGMGAIIELKYYDYALSKTTLETRLNGCIKQIEEHRYYEELLRRKCKRVFLYGFVFDPGKHGSRVKTLNL